MSYQQEADKQQQKIDDLKARGEDEYVIKKQVKPTLHEPVYDTSRLALDFTLYHSQMTPNKPAP